MDQLEPAARHEILVQLIEGNYLNEERFARSFVRGRFRMKAWGRNKIRQAVSWWKAINDQVWHLKSGEQFENDMSFYEEHYDFDALMHLFKEASLRECAIEDYFRKHQLSAFSIVYEDFVMDYEGTIKKVIDFLEIEYDEIHIKAPHYTPTASKGSELWVQRFREDIQKNFQGAPVW